MWLCRLMYGYVGLCSIVFFADLVFSICETVFVK